MGQVHAIAANAKDRVVDHFCTHECLGEGDEWKGLLILTTRDSVSTPPLKKTSRNRAIPRKKTSIDTSKQLRRCRPQFGTGNQSFW